MLCGNDLKDVCLEIPGSDVLWEVVHQPLAEEQLNQPSALIQTGLCHLTVGVNEPMVCWVQLLAEVAKWDGFQPAASLVPQFVNAAGEREPSVLHRVHPLPLPPDRK